MLHAALALAAGLAGPPTAPPIAPAPVHTACAAEIDPQFVHYVAPPRRAEGGNPLLWLIAGSPAERRTDPKVGCAHPIQTRDGR